MLVAMSPSRMPMRCLPSSAARVRRSSVVLPAPGDDIRLTARTPGGGEVAGVRGGHPVVLRQDVLQHHHPGGAGGGVAAVVADVPVLTLVGIGPAASASPWLVSLVVVIVRRGRARGRCRRDGGGNGPRQTLLDVEGHDLELLAGQQGDVVAAAARRTSGSACREWPRPCSRRRPSAAGTCSISSLAPSSSVPSVSIVPAERRGRRARPGGGGRSRPRRRSRAARRHAWPRWPRWPRTATSRARTTPPLPSRPYR